jgi:hypothetical protein
MPLPGRYQIEVQSCNYVIKERLDSLPKTLLGQRYFSVPYVTITRKGEVYSPAERAETIQLSPLSPIISQAHEGGMIFRCTIQECTRSSFYTACTP